MRLFFLTICIASLLAYAETIYTSLDNKSLESSSLAKHHDRSFFFSASYNIGYFYGENKDFEERYSFNIEGFQETCCLATCIWFLRMQAGLQCKLSKKTDAWEFRSFTCSDLRLFDCICSNCCRSNKTHRHRLMCI